MQAFEEKKELSDVLLQHPVVVKHISPSEIHRLLDPHQYIGTAVMQVEQLFKKLQPFLMI